MAQRRGWPAPDCPLRGAFRHFLIVPTEPYKELCAKNPFQRLILIKLLSIKQVARVIKVRLNDFPIAIAVPFPPAYVEPQPPLAIGNSAFRSLEPNAENLEARCAH